MSSSTVALNLTISPEAIAVGHTAKNISLHCQPTGSKYSLVTFMQISKVSPDGSSTPLVELIPGAQQPIYTDDSYLQRSSVAGDLDIGGQGHVYLEMVITKPVKADSGGYRCVLDYLHDVNGQTQPGKFSSDVQVSVA